MRLFIAAPLPEEVREKVSGLYQPMDGLRWQPQSQFHITLKFLGKTDREQLPELIRRLNNTSYSAFQITISGFGIFPEKGRPKILWIGIASPGLLKDLQKKIEQQCVEMGFKAEDRPFVPHITLARIKGTSKRDVMSFVNQHKKVRFPEVPVNKFVLYESKLHPDGAVHEKVEEFPLSAD
ncbi:RNA 2',3'-cyclic phosphodiesterase [Aliifodinibius salicampi]|uniref:RNA 2',3'-cyclic phosphodiesterase n=1 Tax=Fodinibius salicampi TaxID=1920655 RepID=A0ABT3PZS6_9BACT|nr:RNA 2',3'-cyclic phosphodiesterase [Fodinibius salicampi]MCW9713331.1 RNA 2',3'-cyclic phosphodiesterase [Fodinibius salicampi]